MKKNSITPRLSKGHVKFDASSIKSEGRALHKYTNLKRKEHNEGKWLNKLDNMFVIKPKIQDENYDSSNSVAQREEMCNTPDFNKRVTPNALHELARVTAFN